MMLYTVANFPHVDGSIFEEISQNYPFNPYIIENRNDWTSREDRELIMGANHYPNNWIKVALTYFRNDKGELNRSAIACQKRYYYLLRI